MKSVSQYLLSAVAAGALTIAPSLWAQQAGPAASPSPTDTKCGEHHHHHRHGGGMRNPMGFLTKKLNLTDAQQAQIQPIVQQAQPTIQAIRQEEHAKVKAVVDSTVAQIKPLLTADQQKQLDDLLAKRAQREQNRQNGGAQ